MIQHVPVELAERARAAVTAADADGVACLGGGSSTGLAKAIALTHRLPIVAVPTTYAGSEMTTIYGLTGGRHKQTGTSPDVLPRTVIYDPLLTIGLPANVTGASAFNALAHSVESLYATGHNPVTSALALEAVRAIARSLPAVMADPADVGGRSDLLYGAYLSGIALGTTSAGLHHKLCHVLGGTFNLVHADAHAAVLPHAVAFNAPALPEEMARLAEALGAPGGDPAGALWDLAVASGVTTRLADLGLTAEDLPEAAERAAKEITSNPVACRRRCPPRHPARRVRQGRGRGRDRRGWRSAAGLRLPPLAPGTRAFEQVRRDALGGGGQRRRTVLACRGRRAAGRLLVGCREILERRRLHPRLPVAVQLADDIRSAGRVGHRGRARP